MDSPWIKKQMWYDYEELLMSEQFSTNTVLVRQRAHTAGYIGELTRQSCEQEDI